MAETIESCIDAYLDYLRSRGRSENTIVNYAVDLGQFSSYLEREGVSSIDEVDRDSVRIFLSSIIGIGDARTSAARKLSAVRGFVGWLAKRGILASDPGEGLKGPKLPQVLPRALSYEDTVRLLTDGPEAGKNYLRDRLILETLYGSGLRVSELIGLNWEDVELSERMFRVFGKGSKERMVPFGLCVKQLLEKWIPMTGYNMHGPVFKSEKGAERLTVRTVHRLVLKAAARVGLQGTSPHTLRHCFATHMLERGAPLHFVQELLGHDSIATTQRYLSITNEQVKRSYMEAHPLIHEEE